MPDTNDRDGFTHHKHHFHFPNGPEFMKDANDLARLLQLFRSAEYIGRRLAPYLAPYAKRVWESLRQETR
jgi:hypothetical protein